MIGYLKTWGKVMRRGGWGPGWSHWKDAWIGDFKGKDIVLVMDADDAGRKRTRDIAGCFIRAGLPAPRQLILDKGKDLNEFYNLSKGET